MVFDDTFEHSALNPSGEPRSILLMDAWHPSLSLVERKAFSCLIEAISSIERD
jgi:aspartyl/asparaginyl beta-hydroxylase (cupin superfamily)